MNIELYRELVDTTTRTMKSTDLHKFVYETTGKFKALGDFHVKIRDVLSSHIVNGRLPSTLRANKQVEFYSLTEVQCNMLMAMVDVNHLEDMAQVFVAVKQMVVDSYLISNPIDRAKAWIVEQETLQLETTKRKEAETKRNLLIHQNKKYIASELAGELGLKSAIVFNKLLNQHKIQYKVNNTWKLYSKYETLGYADYKQVELDSGKIIYQMRWTGAGRDFILMTFHEMVQNEKIKEENNQKLKLLLGL